MKHLKLLALISSAFATLPASAADSTMSGAQYQAALDEVAAKYSADKATCKAMSGNAKDICMEESKGRERIAKAQLNQTYRPSASNQYSLGMAKATAAYAIAKETCDDVTGDAKSVCRTQAKTTFTKAKADLELAQTSSSTSAESKNKMAGAREEANEEKREADYKLAKSKCELLADNAKDVCIKDAKRRFGQS